MTTTTSPRTCCRAVTSLWRHVTSLRRRVTSTARAVSQASPAAAAVAEEEEELFRAGAGRPWRRTVVTRCRGPSIGVRSTASQSASTTTAAAGRPCWPTARRAATGRCARRPSTPTTTSTRSWADCAGWVSPRWWNGSRWPGRTWTCTRRRPAPRRCYCAPDSALPPPAPPPPSPNTSSRTVRSTLTTIRLKACINWYELNWTKLNNELNKLTRLRDVTRVSATTILCIDWLQRNQDG